MSDERPRVQPPRAPQLPSEAGMGLSPTVKRFLIVAVVCVVAGLLLLIYSLWSVVTDSGISYP